MILIVSLQIAKLKYIYKYKIFIITIEQHYENFIFDNLCD